MQATSSDIADENARLREINAELLAALKNLLAWAETIPTRIDADELQREARAAIAKATGARLPAPSPISQSDMDIAERSF